MGANKRLLREREGEREEREGERKTEEKQRDSRGRPRKRIEEKRTHRTRLPHLIPSFPQFPLFLPFDAHNRTPSMSQSIKEVISHPFPPLRFKIVFLVMVFL